MNVSDIFVACIHRNIFLLFIKIVISYGFHESSRSQSQQFYFCFEIKIKIKSNCSNDFKGTRNLHNINIVFIFSSLNSINEEKLLQTYVCWLCIYEKKLSSQLDDNALFICFITFLNRSSDLCSLFPFYISLYLFN